MAATPPALTVDLVRGLFKEQEQFMNYFFDRLEADPLHDFCKSLRECKGVVVLTGVGKSGFIAQKISMTLVSTGTRSIFLSPVDALHGDIGVLGPDDVLVLFSKSGATEELLKLVPYARAKGAHLIGISSVKGSKLDKACDQHVLLPLERELCPFDLAPVTSTAIQMVFGDTCAVAVSRAKCLTQEEYARNHPAGSMGKRLSLRVKDVMRTAELPITRPETLLVDTIKEMSDKGLGCLLVADAAGRFLGAFTDGDLRRQLNAHGAAALQAPIGGMMTTACRTVHKSMQAVEAVLKMESPTPVTFVPVLEEDGTLAGLLTLNGILAAGL